VFQTLDLKQGSEYNDIGDLLESFSFHI